MEKRNIKFNSYTFTRSHVEKMRSFDEFYQSYKNSAFIQDAEKASEAERAAQKQQLQDAWALIQTQVKQEPQEQPQATSSADGQGNGKAGRKQP